MDKNLEIEFQEEKIEESIDVQLPTNFLTFGEIENDDIKVYIKQDTYKELEKLSSSDTTKELGSILIGNYYQELDKTNIIISNFIKAKYTDASASTLTFTHKTWDYIHTEHEKLYLEKKIIGWQHTHPNYGIFLSNYDMFIHENFFNLPFQIAYVIDPIQNIRGFFQWKNGKIEKLKGYYIYDDVGTPIKIKQIKSNKDTSITKKSSKISTILISLLCVTTILLSIFAFSINSKYEEQLEKQKNISTENKIQKDELTNQKTVINTQADTISKLQDLLITDVLDPSGHTTASDLITMLENNELVLPNQNEILTELKAFINKENVNENELKFIPYTVVPGDNLYNICKFNNIDYKTNANLILTINGITNPDQLYVGQTIILPVTN